ncbi:trehalose-6-phosphate synthase [Rubellimicrobium sp. CFH 75288]|uniref:alpha,alpha-trehalose-phosphate synthase (UDP-forming) n=1 Tax=Rubellimicrobium sp. CFH 75288 TaxID=2697034 RepID=UPI001412F691|nr:trehalose-6-phosphate synthase [Rubellimicrobium sp. CFH 75288]NAZ36687.1 trehalose-6-phosphate synthase [Rubellimicrobium sp. CFH 75288]
MGRLVVVSNRVAAPGETRAGGLAVALAEALAERGSGVWFGWSGDVVPREVRGVRLIAEGTTEFVLSDLTEAEHEGYYLGFANRALWPVFHYRVDLGRFDEGEFDCYAAVNRRLARALLPILRRDDLIWVHDYHLLLFGQELRNDGWQGALGFFLHIPFPAPEVFAALPQHQRLARGLAEFDLVGFQTERDAANFRRYMADSHGAELLADGRLRAFGRTIVARAFPIGIDPDEFGRLAESDEGRDAAARVARITGDRALVIGVDRMDYSKGLPERVHAFGRLLDDNEDLRGRVNLLQIAPPSRESVDAYRDLREELDRLAGRVNGDYSDLDWTPIRYLARSYSRGVLAGLYRLARVGLVTPLRDGMNLVAKEYVAAQNPDDPGVLILSEFAGAAERMGAALLVNPHDVGATSEAIRRAIEMPREERQERWQALDREVREHDVTRWRRDFLSALDALAAGAAP